MNDSWREALRAELAAWEAAGLRRALAPPTGLDFSSSDYLGLARDPRVIAAARAALEEHGAGATSARLLRGDLPPHGAAERACAAWIGEEAALLCPSGWQANAALIPALAGAEDALFSDALNHASLIDAARLSRARRFVFRHGDLAHLDALLTRTAGARRRWIVVEDVYSMDGDLAPLGALLELCARYDALLIVDHAHAAGLYEDRLPPAHPRVAARVVTGGKALGAAGAFVCGSRDLVELVLNRGRAFVFTTAPPPATAAALEAAIRIVRAEPERAARAHANAALLRERLRGGGLPPGGESPIVPVLLGEAARAMEVAAELRAAGFDVRAVRPPTVPEGSSRLRLVCHSMHSEEQVEALAATLLEVVARRPRTLPPPPTRPASAPAQVLAVVGTDTGVGKTVVSALLARALLTRGRRPGYLKPVQTGTDDDVATVRGWTGLSEAHAPRPVVSLPLPASVDQAAAAAGATVRVEEVLTGVRRHIDARRGNKAPDWWIVECAGGLLVPFNRQQDQSDLLRGLGAPIVLVARSGLGTLNHTRLTLEALEARRLRPAALFLVGPPHPGNVGTLSGLLPDLPLFELPQFRAVDAAALDLWLAANDLGPLLGA